MASTITPIRIRFPATRIRAATVSAFMTRFRASLRGTSSAMPSTHSGAISSAALQSGVTTSPNAPGEPSPNQMIGALGAAMVGATTE